MRNIYKYAYSATDAKCIAEEAYKKNYKIVGIEAEWGDADLAKIFEHTDECLSHHGEYADLPPPSTRWDLYGKYKEDTCFIFSHFDLDSIFGCWVLEGSIPDNDEIRSITQFIGWCDVMGAHRAHEDYENYVRWNDLLILISNQLKKLKKEKKNADAIITELRTFFLEQYKSYDITKSYQKYLKSNEDAYNALEKNFTIPNLLHVFISYSNYLNRYHVEHNDFVSISKVNIFYNSLTKRLSIAVYDEKTAKKYFGENGVLGILKKYFGNEAGGRITVGGSPKNQEVPFTKVIKFIKEVKNILLSKGF